MDIFEPEDPEVKELPVIINIHGGALIMGGDRGQFPVSFEANIKSEPIKGFGFFLAKGSD